MKRLLFYTFWIFDNEEFNGICKKIRTQKKVFEENGYLVDFSYIKDGKFWINSGGKDVLLQKNCKPWTKNGAEKQLVKYVKERKYDCAYFRYNCSNFQLINLLKILKKRRTKIFIEIPTFPYDMEYTKNIFYKLFLAVDKLHRGSMKKYVDRIVTYSNHDEIYGIPTIKTINGIDVNSVPKKETFSNSEDIHLICVAMYSLWHALERVLKGLCTYYNGNPETKVYLHVVGDGEALDMYRSIVNDGNIGEYVTFYGRKSGRELDEIYEKCDIAVETLGGHRINIKAASTMKSREYLSRGFPYVSELKTDILPEDWKYVIKIPYDESDVDIVSIVNFYNRYMDTAEKKAQIADEIRNYAIDKIDMQATLQGILKEYNANSPE